MSTALGALFFLSGMSALIYQVVWQRMLSTVFGVTVYATSAVLASFMAGLALGGILGGRLADAVRRPGLAFAAAEAGIALLAAATPRAMVLASHVFMAIPEPAGLGFATLTVLRLGCSFALLLMPTTLMGATLPLVMAWGRGSARRGGSRVAALYGLNTLGALTGVLLAGYVLIGGWGLRGTLRLAMGTNLVVALGALMLASHAPGWGIPSGSGAAEALVEKPEMDAGAPLSRRQGLWLLAVFGLSGLVALGLEVVWFRMLVAYLPTTTYAFTTMLATVLAGMGLGSLMATRGAFRGSELRRLGLLVVATGVLSVAAANVLARTYTAGWRTSGVIQACIVGLLPTTMLMGLSYPRALWLWARATPRLGRRIGDFSAVNLAGGIVGSLLGGFVLIPVLGVRRGLLALASLSVASGLALVWASRTDAAPLRSATPVALLLAAFGVGAATLPDPFTAALARRHRGDRELWREEGVQATVMVHRDPQGQRVLYIDGIHQAGDSPAMLVLHRRIGLMPLVLHPAPRRALVIGLAGGATAGALALDPDIEVEVVELSGAVARASELFRHVNSDLLRRPNVRLQVNDGRHHLLLTRERYDIITADLIQPFHAGAGHLYSLEFFRLCRRALSDSGFMVQWIGHPPEAQYKLLLRTFLEVFPETTLWAQSVLVGSPLALRVSPEGFRRSRAHPPLRGALEDAGLGGPDALIRLFTSGPDELRLFAGPGPILSDDRPLLEYYRSLSGPVRPVDLSGLRGNPAALLAR